MYVICTSPPASSRLTKANSRCPPVDVSSCSPCLRRHQSVLTISCLRRSLQHRSFQCASYSCSSYETCYFVYNYQVTSRWRLSLPYSHPKIDPTCWPLTVRYCSCSSPLTAPSAFVFILNTHYYPKTVTMFLRKAARLSLQF